MSPLSLNNIQILYLSSQIVGAPFCLLANYFLFFCSDLAVFIFPILLAHFKDPIESKQRVSTPWVQLHITILFRSKFVSFSYSGANLGPVITFPLCGLIMDSAGWQMVYNRCITLDRLSET